MVKDRCSGSEFAGVGSEAKSVVVSEAVDMPSVAGTQSLHKHYCRALAVLATIAPEAYEMSAAPASAGLARDLVALVPRCFRTLIESRAWAGDRCTTSVNRAQ